MARVSLDLQALGKDLAQLHQTEISHFFRLHRMPAAYGAALCEVVRRLAFLKVHITPF
jgi:hypothetical protein